MEIKDFNRWWKTNKIEREYENLKKRDLFKEISKYIQDRQILVITGLRRTGKTIIIYQLIENLLNKNIKPYNILYFNFDLEIYDIEKIFNDYEKITGIDYKKEKIYVFLDEIQKLQDWQNKLKLYYDNFKNIKFVVSGSSSLFIEKKTKESLAGRSYSFKLMPLKFFEYLNIKNKNSLLNNKELNKKEIKKELDHYIISGGFPELINESDIFKIKKYIKELVIDKIVYIDIPLVFKIEEPELLQKIISIISSSPGILIDYENIASDLGRNRKTISDYLFYLEKSFLLKKLYNFSKNLLTSEKKLKKFYPTTTALGFLYGANIGSQRENSIVQNSNYDFFYRKGDKEVDFIKTEEPNNIIPIEVKSSDNIRKESITNLIDFIKKFKAKTGYIITDDKESEEVVSWFNTKVKIRLIPLWKWLLEQ